MGKKNITTMEKPIIFELDSQDLEMVKAKYRVDRVIDAYKEQLKDLFLIRNPRHKFSKDYREDLEAFIQEHAQGKLLQACGKWVYFPWQKVLVHYLDNLPHQEVRTARNKNLITKEEQVRFYGFSVGVAGLSVGSHGAITTALMGGSKVMKLADPDVVSPTNLNRMRFDFTQVGENKAELVAQYLYQLNPYAELSVYSNGIDKENLGEFMEGLDLLIEELDDIEMKVMLREEAKKRGIPVVMATDNGDNVILDVERFDLHPDLPIFYGSLEGFNLKELKASPAKMFEAMAKIIDVSLVPPKVLESIPEVGKSIYSWPQLASAATLSGAVLAYVIRRIALGENVREGKFEVNLDAVADLDYEGNAHVRRNTLERFLDAVGLTHHKHLWIKES